MDLVWVNDDFSVENKLIKKEDELIEWVSHYRPSVLAIDAPSGKNLGRTRDPAVRADFGWTKKFAKRKAGGEREPKYGNMRVSEAILTSHNIQLYSTPPNSDEADEWIQCGWRLYERIRTKLGYHLWRDPGKVAHIGTPTIVEVHPHACFVVGLGWIPQVKSSLAGQLERAAYIRNCMNVNGGTLRGDCLPMESLVDVLLDSFKTANWGTILALKPAYPEAVSG